MGPVIDRSTQTIELRPFQPSQTLSNLQRHPFGVFHLIDDATMFSNLVTAQNVKFEHEKTPSGNGFRMVNCNHWIEFEVKHLDLSANRANINGVIVDEGTVMPFRGFSRANNAILEASILATRVDFIPFAHIESEFVRLTEIVHKTGGAKEIAAMSELDKFIRT